MSNIALQLQMTTGTSVANNANVIFNSITFTTGSISVDTNTGIITFLTPGQYFVNWWLGSLSSPVTTGLTFALSSSQGDFIKSSSPIKTGEISGIGYLDITTANTTMSLVNASGDTVSYADNIPVLASLMIIENTTGDIGPTGPTGATGATGPTGSTAPVNLGQNLNQIQPH